MAKIRSKIFREMWPSTIMALRVIGRSKGKTTCRYVCSSLAPSTRAASRNSSGMPRSPARYMAIV